MQNSRRVVQLIARQVGQQRQASGHGHGHHAVVGSTYNDLPSPSGSWQTNYDSQQRKYNAQLLLGVAALAGTLVFGKAVGMFEFYNDYPERPATIDNYKE